MPVTIGNSLLSKLKPRNKPYDVRDDKLTGFLIRVNISGKMLYMCEYARGKRIIIGKVGVLTPAQARDRAKEILADAIKGINPNASRNEKKRSYTLAEYINNEYSVWVIANRKRGKETVARLKANFIKNIGDTILNEISPLQIERWRTSRLSKGVKASTINRDIIALKAAISKAVEWEFINVHPLIKLKLSKVDDCSRIRYLDNDEEVRLRNALNIYAQQLKNARSRANEWRSARNYTVLPDLKANFFAHYIQPIILLTINTGLRRGELFNLCWRDINFDKSILTVVGDNAKNTKTRHIPLNTEALNTLKDWRGQIKLYHNFSSISEQYIFTGIDGKRLTSIKRIWSTIMKLAKINNFRFHDLRHHFASRMVMAGVDLNTVRELLGHSDIKMTLRYAHLAPEHKAAAVAKLVNGNY